MRRNTIPALKFSSHKLRLRGMPNGRKGARPQFDPRVYDTLRKEGDDFIVLYDTADEPTLDIRRHGSNKPVLVVATRFFIYLFKKKDMRLYRRWAVRDVSVDSDEDVLCITGADVPAKEKLEYYAATRRGTSGRGGGGGGDSGSSSEDEVEVQKAAIEGLLAPEKALARAREKFQTVFLNSYSPPAARTITQLLQAVISDSRQELWKVEQQEMGQTKKGAKQVRFAEPGDAEDDGGDSSDEELLRTVQRGGIQAGGRKWAKSAGESGGASSGRSSMEEASAALWRQGALASVVDSSTTDFGVLRQAFQRKQDEALMSDIRTYVEENDERMQVLSREHYRSFLNAARLCDDIKTEDALQVQGELSGAMQLVTHAAQEMRSSAAQLVVANTTRSNMVVAGALLEKLSRTASMLETCELLLQKERHLSVIRAVTELCAFVTGNGLSNLILGHYILHVRSPMIQRQVIHETLAQANKWLKGLRGGAPAVGESALLAAFTRSVHGTQVSTSNPRGCHKRLVVRSTQRPDLWALVDQFIPAASEDDSTAGPSTPSTFAGAFRFDDKNSVDDGTDGGITGGAEGLALAATAAMEEVMTLGPSVQEVFSGCGLSDSFTAYYFQSRTKQLSLDTERSASGGGEAQLQFVLQDALVREVTSLVGSPATLETTTGMIEMEASKRAFSDVARYLSICCGIMLMEDLVHHTTSPPVQSTTDIARTWAVICDRVAVCINEAGSSLVAAGAMRMINMMVGGGGDTSNYLVDNGSVVEASMGCLLTLARSFCDVVVHGVCSVELDVLPIQRVVEGLICKLHSQWLQEYSVAVSNTLAEDNLAPLIITDETEFNALLVPNSLHMLSKVRLGSAKAPLLLPVPLTHKAGHLYLPFTLSVPKIAMLTRRFLEKCIYLLGEGPLNSPLSGSAKPDAVPGGKRGSVASATRDTSALYEVTGVQVRDVLGVSGGVGAGVASRAADTFELNNIDSMMLEYVGVLFKTAHGVLQSRVQVLKEKSSSLLQLAMLASTSLALGLVTSVAEQQFALWWQGTAGETFGSIHEVLDAIRLVQDSPQAVQPPGLRTLGGASLLQANLTKFLELSDTCVGAMSNCLVTNIDELIAPMGKLGYYRKKLPSTSVFSMLSLTKKNDKPTPQQAAQDKKAVAKAAATQDAAVDELGESYDMLDMTTSALSSAIEYANGSLSKLATILPASILHSTAQMLVMHVSERLNNLVSDALTTYQGREIGLIRQCVSVFEEECTPAVAKWLGHLNTAYPQEQSNRGGGGNTKLTYSFPFAVSTMAEAVRSWASSREVYWAEISAQEMMLKAGLESAGKAVLSGVQTVGSATKKGFFGFGRKVVSGADATSKFVTTAGGLIGKGGDEKKGGDFLPSSAQSTPPLTPREGSVFDSGRTAPSTPSSTPPSTVSRAPPPPPIQPSTASATPASANGKVAHHSTESHADPVPKPGPTSEEGVAPVKKTLHRRKP